MKKHAALSLINSKISSGKLSYGNTSFSNLINGTLKPQWWMNIKLDKFKGDVNIVLVGLEELFWLKIPANTFTNVASYFKIWEEKNAVDIHISAERNDRYMKDIASGGFLVDFKPFIKERIEIPNELMNYEDNKKPQNSINIAVAKELKKPSQIIIRDNQKNISYKFLFEEYLKGSQKVTIQDPYIRYHNQFENLVEFCQLLEDVKKDGQYLHFELVTWNSDEFKNNSREYLHSLRDSLNESGIKFTYKFEDKHDRFIQTDTGWKILLGRGLDIFHKINSKISLAHRDQTKRRCKECEITYIRN